jgi:hypothetical protein
MWMARQIQCSVGLDAEVKKLVGEFTLKPLLEICGPFKVDSPEKVKSKDRVAFVAAVRNKYGKEEQ